MFESLLNAFRAPDIRRRILFVLGILIIVRGMAHVPVPGADTARLADFFNSNALFGLLDVFSGGGLSKFSVIGLGVNPYINASIIMQLMTGVIPALVALQREGEYGRNKINQYTRYLSVPMAVLSSYGFLALLASSRYQVITDFGLSSFTTITQIVTLTAGSIFLMWLGELITEKGIGNGISFIIFAGIVGKIPSSIQSFMESPNLLLLVAHRRVRGGRHRDDHLHHGGPAPDPGPVREPRPRPADVPGRDDVPAAAGQPGRRHPDHLRRQHPAPARPRSRGTSPERGPARRRHRDLHGQLLRPEQPDRSTVALYFLLTVGFTYFYTAFTFKPDETAEQLRKNGGFIPGIRPGRPTEEYLHRVVNRITVAGALFLGIIAVMPIAFQAVVPSVGNLALGGTSLLILVSVVVETMKQLEAQLMMRNYEGFIR